MIWWGVRLSTTVPKPVLSRTTSKSAACTVRVAVPEMVPDVAVTVTGVADAATAEARPGLGCGAVLIVATLVFEDFQAAVAVTSSTVPSLKNASASNCCVAFRPIVALAGETVMD